MPTFKFEQRLGQLEKRKGGYYYIKIAASMVDQYEKKRATRLLCTLDQHLSYSCGLNHFGDGHYFIIVATKYTKELDKSVGDIISVEITEDPNPLGVEIPEVLSVLLAQDEEVKTQFDALTDGKKRTLIYSILKTKDIDKQIQTCLKFLDGQSIKRH